MSLRAEVAALEEAGHTVVVVEPDRDALAAMGHDLMCGAACSHAAREAFLDVGRHAARLDPRLGDVLGQGRLVA